MLGMLDVLAILILLSLAYTFASWHFPVLLTNRIERLTEQSFYCSLLLACLLLGVRWLLTRSLPGCLSVRVQIIQTTTHALLPVMFVLAFLVLVTQRRSAVEVREGNKCFANANGSWQEISPDRFESMAKTNIRHNLAMATMPIWVVMVICISAPKME
jgi:hypothetical protein